MDNALEQYRKANGLTKEGLSDFLGIEKTTLWRWETGRIPAERVVDVETVTGIPRAKLRPDIFGDAA